MESALVEDDDWCGGAGSCSAAVREKIDDCSLYGVVWPGNRLAVWLPGRGYVVLGSGLRGAWEVRHEERVARQVASAGECCAVQRCQVMSRCAGERDRGDEEDCGAAGRRHECWWWAQAAQAGCGKAAWRGSG